jgi:WD40 repeat protein
VTPAKHGIQSISAITLLMLCASTSPATAGVWNTTGAMGLARSRHTATVLPDERVLVAGGLTGSLANLGTTRAAELYDPVTGTWSFTGTMTTARSRHTAILLPDGNVLVAGGRDGNLATAAAELFDVSVGVWTQTGHLNIPRDSHTATLLVDGRVLVTGGLSGGDGRDNPAEKTAEIYDPGTGAWTVADHMAHPRWGHTATLLADGTVLVAGGTSPAGDGVYTVRSELYDPLHDVWRNVDPMATPRGFHAAALLLDGRVLVAGGFTLPPNERHRTGTAELFQPVAEQWAPTGSMAVARGTGPHGATLLPDGRLLVAGGGTRTAELYDPNSGTWSVTASMAELRSSHTVTLLTNGAVLVAGGETPAGIIATAEVFHP